jgi:hypothetical protein
MPTFPIKVGSWKHAGEERHYMPVTSKRGDSDIVCDGIPGDRRSAEFATRCCNLIYMTAVDDVLHELENICSPVLMERIKKRLYKNKIKNAFFGPLSR